MLRAIYYKSDNDKILDISPQYASHHKIPETIVQELEALIPDNWQERFRDSQIQERNLIEARRTLLAEYRTSFTAIVAELYPEYFL